MGDQPHDTVICQWWRFWGLMRRRCRLEDYECGEGIRWWATHWTSRRRMIIEIMNTSYQGFFCWKRTKRKTKRRWKENTLPPQHTHTSLPNLHWSLVMNGIYEGAPHTHTHTHTGPNMCVWGSARQPLFTINSFLCPPSWTHHFLDMSTNRIRVV